MGYVTIAEARAEGITVAQASDARLQILIDLWSTFVDRATGQWFDARTLTFKMDGTGTPVLFLDVPVILITTATVDGSLVPSTDFVVYNRHLGGLLAPDDRGNPKLEYVGVSTPWGRGRAAWNRGTQNVELVGKFGYTDPNGTADGKTPDLIKRVTIMLVVRGLALLADTDAVQAAQNAVRITEERTRDQSVSYGRGRIDLIGQGSTPWTDDPDINMILDMYRAPPIVRTTS